MNDVGILALQIYIPPTYILQSELEVHDGVSSGKYTIGLGQDSLAFCGDQEDVISMSLTVVQELLEKHKIDPSSIGRLEVGSETVIDKSKSIKSAIMPLFEKSGNMDIEGVDSTNACYGGTAALLNSVNWVESSSWDGRYAIVVAVDSAVYAEGPARPTGGAGAVALLIGPNAPLSMERLFTSTYSSHVYDFYKPKLASEYPVVDGKLSQTCYLKALDMCYSGFCKKYEKHQGEKFTLENADYVVFHSPYNKLVQKSFARLLFNDFVRFGSLDGVEDSSSLAPFKNMPEEESYMDRNLEKAAMQISKGPYAKKVAPTAILPKQIGNTYTASLYTSLTSVLSTIGKDLEGKRLLMFSYGSGLVSSMFSFRVQEGVGQFTLGSLLEAMDVPSLLSARLKVTPEEFVSTMELMETRYGACDFIPKTPIDHLRPGTFFLTGVDSLYRRTYDRKSVSVVSIKEPSLNGFGHKDLDPEEVQKAVP